MPGMQPNVHNGMQAIGVGEVLGNLDVIKRKLKLNGNAGVGNLNTETSNIVIESSDKRTSRKKDNSDNKISKKPEQPSDKSLKNSGQPRRRRRRRQHRSASFEIVDTNQNRADTRVSALKLQAAEREMPWIYPLENHEEQEQFELKWDEEAFETSNNWRISQESHDMIKNFRPSIEKRLYMSTSKPRGIELLQQYSGRTTENKPLFKEGGLAKLNYLSEAKHWKIPSQVKEGLIEPQKRSSFKASHIQLADQEEKDDEVGFEDAYSGIEHLLKTDLAYLSKNRRSDLANNTSLDSLDEVDIQEGTLDALMRNHLRRRKNLAMQLKGFGLE